VRYDVFFQQDRPAFADLAATASTAGIYIASCLGRRPPPAILATSSSGAQYRQKTRSRRGVTYIP
jgi:hypothetical protein